MSIANIHMEKNQEKEREREKKRKEYGIYKVCI